MYLIMDVLNGGNKKMDKEIDKTEEIEEKEEDVDESVENDVDDDKKEDVDKKTGKTFTQDQVNQMMAREKKQGANSVYKALGISAKDEETKKAIREFLESRKTDAQKQAEAELKKNAEVEEANKRVAVAEAKAEAMQLGVQKQYVDDVVTLVLAKVSSEDGLDIKTVIGELKTKYPVWFEEEEKEDKKEKAKKTGQRGTGSSVKTKKDKDSEGKSLGAKLAARRKTGSDKKSYWSR